jgi:hypothetical protein
MKKYRYVYIGMVNIPFDSRLYRCSVQIPIDSQAREEAGRCRASCRFEKEGRHVVLKIYEDYFQGLTKEIPPRYKSCAFMTAADLEKRRKFIEKHWREGPGGEVLSVIPYEEMARQGVAITRYAPCGDVEEKVSVYRPVEDVNTPWDALFDADGTPDGWSAMVRNESCRIDTIIAE